MTLIVDLELVVAGETVYVAKSISPGFNALHASFGVHWLRLGPYEILRFSNGVDAEQKGGFFFKWLGVRGDGLIQPLGQRLGEQLNGGQYIIAPRSQDGGDHYFPPRAVLTRRFRQNRRGEVERVSNIAIPTSTELLAHPLWVGAGIAKKDAITLSLLQGTSLYGSGFVFPQPGQQMTGPWRPAGIHEGYAHGGADLEPTPGWALNYEAEVLAADAIRERTNIDLLDADFGTPLPNPEHVNLQDYGATQGRYGTAWSVRLSSDPYWSPYGPKDINSGQCSYRDDINAFQLIDGEHKLREVAHDVACAALWGDPCCAFNVQVSARRVLDAWPLQQVNAFANGAKGTLSRQFGWVAWVIASAEDLEVRAGHVHSDVEAWLEAAARAFVNTQLKAGVWQDARFPWQNWSPTPTSQGVAPIFGVAQALEHGILIAGAFAVWNQLGEGRLKTALGNAILRAADVWAHPLATSPKHFIGATQNGSPLNPPPPQFGAPDTAYVWWSLAYANRVARAQPAGWITRALGNGDSDRYLRAMLRLSGISDPAVFVAQFGKVDVYTPMNVDAVLDMEAAARLATVGK